MPSDGTGDRPDLPWERVSPVSILPIEGQGVGFLVAVAWGGLTLDVLGAVIIGTLALIPSFIRWWSTRWCLAEGAFWVHRGVIRREQRRIPLGRAHEVEIVEPPVLRIFGLCRLRVETGAGIGESEIFLTGLSLPVARALSADLRGDRALDTGDPPTSGDPSTGGPVPAPAPPPPSLIRLSNRRLALAGITGRRLAFPALALGWIVGQANTFFGDDGVVGLGNEVLSRSETVTLMAWVGLVILGLVVWIAGAAIWSLVSDHRLEARVTDGRLRVERGLLTRRRSELELSRCQTVSLVAPLIRRVTGTADLEVRVAGGSTEGGGSGSITIPMLRPDEIRRICAVLPGIDDPLVPLTPAPPAARRRQLIAGLIEPLLVSVAAVPLLVIFLDWRPGVALAVVLVVFGVLGGELTARGWGYALGDSMLVARRGPIRRVTVAMPLDRVQAADLSTGPIQRRWNLATLRVGGAGGQNVVTITDQIEPRMRSVLARCLPTASPHHPGR